MSLARAVQLKAEIARRKGEPRYLRGYCRQLDFTPDGWQVEVLGAQERRLHTLCARQSGKSFIGSLKAMLSAVSKPKSETLIIAPTLRQSTELFRKTLAFIHHPLARVPSIKAENKLSLEFNTGSRIVALPGASDTIRGFSNIQLIVADEASFIPNEVRNAFSPMLAVSNGQLLAMSTPFLSEGWFFDASTSDDWRHWIKPATENPRITSAFLESEKRAMGEQIFACEYLCQWLPAGSFNVFSPELIEQAQVKWEAAIDWQQYL